MSNVGSRVHDLIVVGCGGIGSAVLEQAARTGADVLGIDQFNPPHSMGSSHGHTRIIRQAYFEHPDYVPLLLEAYEGWYDLERRFGRQLFFPTGLIQSGPAHGQVVPGVLESAHRNALDVKHWTSREAQQRFPMFRFPESHEIAFEPAAGYLLVEHCVEAHRNLAVQGGAVLWTDTTVFGMRSEDRWIELATSRGPIRGKKVVVTAGAWAGQLLSECRIPLQALRKHLHWFQSNDRRFDVDRGCPVFLFELDEGCFYGFPNIEGRGLKVAEHSGGEPVSDPGCLSPQMDPIDLERNCRFAQRYLEGAFEHAEHSVCMYTMSMDQHFVIDLHPVDPRILFACGFSGHGFKFATVLGKLLSHWSLAGVRDVRLAFLGMRTSHDQR